VRPLVLPDGVRLSVTEYRPVGEPALTVVLLHGWTLDTRLWRRQMADLTGRLSAPVTVLAYDIRGHGRSTATNRRSATLTQLADDLAAVLRERVPTGRIVLVGHSLGGMTIMEYAHRYRTQFAKRVAGVVFVATSAEGSRHTTYGLSPTLASLVRLVEVSSAEILARSGSWRPHRLIMPVLGPGLRWLVFGTNADARALRLTTAMIGSARLGTIGGFRPAVRSHERVGALAAMTGLPVSVLVGSRDRLTPRRCAENIAAAIPGADHRVLDDAGHMLPLERPDDVTDAIAQVCRRALRRPNLFQRIRRAPRPRAGSDDQQPTQQSTRFATGR
jgi:pimeloyl-ACP methyl ester carboxylesterase